MDKDGVGRQWTERTPRWQQITEPRLDDIMRLMLPDVPFEKLLRWLSIFSHREAAQAPPLRPQLTLMSHIKLIKDLFQTAQSFIRLDLDFSLLLPQEDAFPHARLQFSRSCPVISHFHTSESFFCTCPQQLGKNWCTFLALNSLFSASEREDDWEIDVKAIFFSSSSCPRCHVKRPAFVLPPQTFSFIYLFFLAIPEKPLTLFSTIIATSTPEIELH